MSGWSSGSAWPGVRHSDLPGAGNTLRQSELIVGRYRPIVLAGQHESGTANVTEPAAGVEAAQGPHDGAVTGGIGLHDLFVEGLPQCLLLRGRKQVAANQPGLRRQSERMHHDQSRKEIKPAAQ